MPTKENGNPMCPSKKAKSTKHKTQKKKINCKLGNPHTHKNQ